MSLCKTLSSDTEAPLSKIEDTKESENKKRSEPTPSIERMLEEIEKQTWVHVLDEASDMPDVFNIQAEHWLQVLSPEEKAYLAVSTHAKKACFYAWADATDKHGHSSEQAKAAANAMERAAEEFDATVEQAMESAKKLLGTNE